MTQKFRFELQIEGPERSERFRLPEGATTLGRRPENDLVLAHPYVSGQHARIDCTATGCQLTDLESTNGTIVDDEKASPHTPVPLTEGTVVRIGPFSLTCAQVAVEGAAEPDAPPPTRIGEKLPEPESPPEPEPDPEAEAPRPEEPPPPPPPPPSPPSPPPPTGPTIITPDPAEPLPGLTRHSERLLGYLPGIYHNDFMARFLAIFEATLTPIEWTVDNFDLYLNPRTAPAGFLPWLANWYQIAFDSTWSEAQRRTFLAEAPHLYARRGTRWALRRTLEIYTGRVPEIVEFEDDDPFIFTVHLPLRRNQVDPALVEQLIDAHKPAHTSYRLRFAG